MSKSVEIQTLSRQDLLKWLNEKYNLNYEKVEQLCNGAAFCLIMDSIFPGKVPLQKVNFNAKFEYESIQNYKILQTIFNQNNISRVIEVNKLIQGRYQDNFEFLQWLKRFHDSKLQNYETNSPKEQPFMKRKESIQISNPILDKSLKKENSLPNILKRESFTTGKSNVIQTNQKITELQVTILNLQKERDYYFSKIREIDLLCQQQDSQLADEIKKILYDAEETE